MASMLNIPDELIVYLTKYLGTKDIYCLSHTSIRLYHVISSNDHLWKGLFRRCQMRESNSISHYAKEFYSHSKKSKDAKDDSVSPLDEKYELENTKLSYLIHKRVERNWSLGRYQVTEKFLGAYQEEYILIEASEVILVTITLETITKVGPPGLRTGKEWWCYFYDIGKSGIRVIKHCKLGECITDDRKYMYDLPLDQILVSGKLLVLVFGWRSRRPKSLRGEYGKVMLVGIDTEQNFKQIWAERWECKLTESTEEMNFKEMEKNAKRVKYSAEVRENETELEDNGQEEVPAFSLEVEVVMLVNGDLVRFGLTGKLEIRYVKTFQLKMAMDIPRDFCYDVGSISYDLKYIVMGGHLSDLPYARISSWNLDTGEQIYYQQDFLGISGGFMPMYISAYFAKTAVSNEKVYGLLVKESNTSSYSALLYIWCAQSGCVMNKVDVNESRPGELCVANMFLAIHDFPANRPHFVFTPDLKSGRNLNVYDLEGNESKQIGWKNFDIPPLATFETLAYSRNCKTSIDKFGNDARDFNTRTIKKRKKRNSELPNDYRMIQSIDIVGNGSAFLLQYCDYVALFPLPLKRSRLESLCSVKIIPMTTIKEDETETEIDWYYLTATKLIMCSKGNLKICDFMIGGRYGHG